MRLTVNSYESTTCNKLDPTVLYSGVCIEQNSIKKHQQFMRDGFIGMETKGRVRQKKFHTFAVLSLSFCRLLPPLSFMFDLVVTIFTCIQNDRIPLLNY